MTRQELKFVLENGGIVKDRNGNLKTGVVEFDADMEKNGHTLDGGGKRSARLSRFEED